MFPASPKIAKERPEAARAAEVDGHVEHNMRTKAANVLGILASRTWMQSFQRCFSTC